MDPLFNDPYLNTLAEEANRRDEWATKRFWLRVFTKHAFPEQEWIHGTEVPPREHHCQLRIDLTVQSYDSGSRMLAFRVIAQAKKYRSGPAVIAEVEAQVHQMCQIYLEEQNLPSLWAITFYGTYARIWAFQRGRQYLIPFYPLDRSQGDKRSYRDIRYCHGDFLWAFGVIKSTPFPDPDNFTQLYNETTAVSPAAVAGPSEQSFGSGIEHSVASLGTAYSSEAASEQLRTVRDKDYESVKVTRIEGDRTVCKRKNGAIIAVLQELWEEAWIVRDGQYHKGFIAEPEGMNLRTKNNPWDMSG